MGLAFIMYGREEEADGMIERMTRDQDPIIRCCLTAVPPHPQRHCLLPRWEAHTDLCSEVTLQGHCAAAGVLPCSRAC